MKHSMSSGSFSKINVFESSWLKQSRVKNSRKFLIERKQINLQSNSREASKSREKSKTDSKSRLSKHHVTKLSNSHLLKQTKSTTNLK